MSKAEFAPEATARLIEQGNRRALARAITLVESAHPVHRQHATTLPATLRKDRQAIRIGLAGTPGVGKSTFIESFGLHLVESGLKVAVLAVDPSSARSGGSILGDKVLVEHNSRSKFRASSSNLSYLETSVEATNRCDVVLGRRIHLLMIVAL